MNKTILTVKPMRTTMTPSGNPRKVMEVAKTIITDEDTTTSVIIDTLDYEDYQQVIDDRLKIQYDVYIKLDETSITVADYNRLKKRAVSEQ